LGIKRLLVYGDSTVVINQVNKSWDHNKENMDAYCLEVRKLEGPIRRPERGGSEWEPIKILLEGD
jgi:ribonuclease HI